MRIKKISTRLNLNIETLEDTFIQFFDSLGVNMKLKSLIPVLERDIIINNVNYARLNNNPRLVTQEVIREFLAKADE